MVSAIYHVTHTSCSLCSAEGVELYTLILKAGEGPRLEPKGATTWAGWCKACCIRIGTALLKTRSPRLVVQ